MRLVNINVAEFGMPTYHKSSCIDSSCYSSSHLGSSLRMCPDTASVFNVVNNYFENFPIVNVFVSRELRIWFQKSHKTLFGLVLSPCKDLEDLSLVNYSTFLKRQISEKMSQKKSYKWFSMFSARKLRNLLQNFGL